MVCDNPEPDSSMYRNKIHESPWTLDSRKIVRQIRQNFGSTEDVQLSPQVTSVVAPWHNQRMLNSDRNFRVVRTSIYTFTRLLGWTSDPLRWDSENNLLFHGIYQVNCSIRFLYEIKRAEKFVNSIKNNDLTFSRWWSSVLKQ